ncbi:TPA: GNAT family N-acetyltransferase [Streptococcus agalactiae]
MKIRTATLDDSEKIVPLYQELGYAISLSEIQSILKVILTHSDYGFLIAEDNGKLLAFVGYHKLYFFEKSGTYYRILALVVNEKHRRKGIASQLINHVKQLAKTDGSEVLALNSSLKEYRQEAYHFYENLGFKKVSTGFSYYLD